MNISESNRNQTNWGSIIYCGAKNTCLWATRAITIGGLADFIFCLTADTQNQQPHVLNYWDKKNICNYAHPTSPAFIYKLPLALLKERNSPEILNELCKAKTELLYTDIVTNDNLFLNLFMLLGIITVINVYYQVIWEDPFEIDQADLQEAPVIDLENSTTKEVDYFPKSISQVSPAPTETQTFSPLLDEDDMEVAQINGETRVTPKLH